MDGRRRLGEVLVGRELEHGHPVAALGVGERLLVFERLVLAFLVGFAIQRQESGDLHHAARGPEQIVMRVPSLAHDVEIERGGVEDGRRHL